ncbi:hypothetical protein [Protofrankia symbiont of Coriaria ruscifolia]|uniref:hypothetical protein n=1 Tax=Protofrankia symbiont of Coriaria ruscifolia TaxID=1306542 RepID=UPI0010412C6B|nr:hypothetical protein [Protofrankia symbiont of Coriaria ruscifolia]
MAARLVPADYAADVLAEHGQVDGDAQDVPAVEPAGEAATVAEAIDTLIDTETAAWDAAAGAERTGAPVFEAYVDGLSDAAEIARIAAEGRPVPPAVAEYAVLHTTARQLGQLQACVRMLELALDAGDFTEIARVIRAAVAVAR